MFYTNCDNKIRNIIRNSWSFIRLYIILAAAIFPPAMAHD